MQYIHPETQNHRRIYLSKMLDLPINYTYNPDTGNLASNAGVSYTYGNNNHKHAVTSASNGNTYGYDQNGSSRRVRSHLNAPLCASSDIIFVCRITAVLISIGE